MALYKNIAGLLVMCFLCQGILTASCVVSKQEAIRRAKEDATVVANMVHVMQKGHPEKLNKIMLDEIKRRTDDLKNKNFDQVVAVCVLQTRAQQENKLLKQIARNKYRL